MTAPQVSDTQRDALAIALTAALLLMLRGKVRQTLDRIGRIEQAATLTDAQKERVATFARDRARAAQNGINTRLAATDAADHSIDHPTTVQGKLNDMRGYNATTLLPFLGSWATHQALVDVYSDTPDPNDPSKSLRDTALWTWQQNTENPDDCMEADAASPTSLDALLAITGSPPPVHSNCQCTLSADGGF